MPFLQRSRPRRPAEISAVSRKMIHNLLLRPSSSHGIHTSSPAGRLSDFSLGPVHIFVTWHLRQLTISILCHVFSFRPCPRSRTSFSSAGTDISAGPVFYLGHVYLVTPAGSLGFRYCSRQQSIEHINQINPFIALHVAKPASCTVQYGTVPYRTVSHLIRSQGSTILTPIPITLSTAASVHHTPE